MNLFVFGLGYTALHFVGRSRALFDGVAGTVRSPEKAERLARDGIATRIFGNGAADPKIAADLDQADAILVSVPAGDAGDPVLRQFAEAITRAEKPAWIGYLSTIGVYGNHDGAWIDEKTSPRPASLRSRQRLAAELAWLELGARSGKPVQVFRLAGIYGPGRSPLQKLADGSAKRIVKPGQVFNRAHVDDIASVLLASIQRSRQGAIYNVTDDEPAPPQDVVTYAAGLASLEPPPEEPFDSAALTPMARSFYGENKRVRNRLLREELGVDLAFPTYREGLRAIRDAEKGPRS